MPVYLLSSDIAFPSPKLTSEDGLLAVGGDLDQKRLLLAYDSSKRARSARYWASSLQRTLPAEVVVVAVQENGIQAADAWLEEARAQLTSGRCLHRLGQPASEIVAAAAETQADLIVMGRYRHTAALEWLTGSTVDRVLHGTKLPVLIG